ncbi:hypothetical protein GZH53_02095 [Flavihumibacter sp. R14]|nr:hypothetical protein [Flavihumibacter soli]
MKSVNVYSLLVVLILASSCKKTVSELTPEPISFKDSVSFIMNGTKYSFTERNTNGIGNRQVNIKPYAALLSDRDWEYETGGFYWYGDKDSTLYDTFYGFHSRKDYDTFQISFSKKFHNNQLRKSYSTLFVPADNSDLFKLGEQHFAVDLNLENTMDGISVEFHQPFKATMTSYIPGFSILINTNLPKTIQDDSRFEITQVKRLDDKYYLIEAKFTVNLFDENAQPYRLENGFLRIKTGMKVFDPFEPANALK